MKSQPDIVMLALPHWDGPYSNTSFSLAKEFSKSGRVFLIDNPYTLKDIFTGIRNRKIRSRLKYFFSACGILVKNENLTVIIPPPVLPVNWFPQGRLYRFLASVNSFLVFTWIKRALRRLNVRNYIFINSFNPFYQHFRFLKPDLFIYHTVDDIRLSPYVRKHGTWREPEMVAAADMTLTTSVMLKKLNEKYSSHVYCLPNAADFDIFGKRTDYNRPEEIKRIVTPIIIFTGHLDWRTDLVLLKSIPAYHKDKTLLIVGPVSIRENHIRELSEFHNVIFTGSRPLEKLPEYLYWADCAIIPFSCNELTNSIYPLKINEYLAAGKPVVSTMFSADIMNFRQIISLAPTSRIFNQKIDFEIGSNNPDKQEARRKVARNNTWPARIRQFWEMVDPYLKDNELAEYNPPG